MKGTFLNGEKKDEDKIGNANLFNKDLAPFLLEI